MSHRVKPITIIVNPRAVSICVRAALGLPLPMPRYGLVLVPV